ncbi:hypothetical protein BGZ54_004583 [Gamsiella multidivaricata]|nr:hypothetical protein BGZ54_004583 [Gamsiella multidivaricata]
MTEQNSSTYTSTTTAPNTGRRPSFAEKIKEKISGTLHHHHHHDQDQRRAGAEQMQHQYGGPSSAHDNAYVGEANVVGAHAIPPMTSHVNPTTASQQRTAMANKPSVSADDLPLQG